MNEAVVFSQPLVLDLLVVIILHHCFQTAVIIITGSGLKVGVVSQKISSRKKEPPLSKS